MWYTETEEKQLDLTKPICATTDFGDKTLYLLLPTNRDNSYEFRGYNWLNVDTGKWNSCKDFKTVDEAIKTYSNVRNCTIGLR